MLVINSVSILSISWFNRLAPPMIIERGGMSCVVRTTSNPSGTSNRYLLTTMFLLFFNGLRPMLSIVFLPMTIVSLSVKNLNHRKSFSQNQGIIPFLPMTMLPSPRVDTAQIPVILFPFFRRMIQVLLLVCF